MEASSKLRGGQHYKRALELHQEEEAATLVSKRINLGHNNSNCCWVEHKEASTVGGGRRRHKRALERELHLHEEEGDDGDDDHWEEEEEATFVAGADGAYTNLEMPKRLNRGYNVGETSPRRRALDAEDERDTALVLRLRSAVADTIRDMYAKAKAKQAQAAAHHT